MANKSVLELAVGTGQWDAGLKKAKQSLENFTQANGGLQQALNKDSASVQKFVQMMGQMGSTAYTAKGQMNDYKSTIEQLTMQYNRMTDAQKQTIGQDYLNTIDQLRQKYQSVNDELQEMNRTLNQTKLPEPSTSGDSGGGIAGGALSVFGGNLMTKGFELAQNAAMGFVNTLKEAAAQGIEMARSGEGVRNAFERLNQPGLLDNLREATHGTVTNLELMKAAVKFNDFNLPLKELGTMLAFAQQKAKDTGQSVDYMVDSIVTGLGRKSLMILDNLGLSAANIKERMAETGDMTTAVGEIIREQMSSAGDYVETAADCATAAQVELNNALEDLGRTLLPLEEQGVSMWNKIEIAAIKMLNDGLKPIVPKLIEVKTEIGEIYDAAVTDNWLTQGFINWLETGIDVTSRFIPYVRTLKKLIDGLSGGGDMGASVGAAISGAITDNTVTDIPEVVVTGNKPKNPKGGSKTTISKSTSEPTFAPDSIAAQQRLVADLTKQWNEAGADVRSQYVQPLVEAEAKLKSIKDEQALMKEQAQGKLLGGEVEIPAEANISSSIYTSIEEIRNELAENPIKIPIETTTKDVKAIAKAASITADVVGSIGDAFNAIEDPAAKVAGTVMQAIANVALGYAMATKQASLLGPWAWIAFAASGLATMITTISAIHSSTGYAEGGMIKGNSYSGDNIGGMVDGSQFVGLNAGELVLNQAQQGNLASRLSDQGRGMNIVGEIQGEKIVLVANRFFKRTGQGEIVTW